MRFLPLVLFGCWGGSAPLRAQAVAPGDSTRLRCVVRTLKTEYHYREPIAFEVQLINNSKQPVVLVDGHVNSGIWDCFPRPELRVYRLRKGLPKKQLEENAGSSCLKTWASAENFALVGPGQYITLESVREVGVPLLFHAFKFYEQLAPGQYEVTFTYSTVTNENAIRNFIYFQPKQKQAELRALVDRVSALTLNSAPLYLTITRSKSN